MIKAYCTDSVDGGEKMKTGKNQRLGSGKGLKFSKKTSKKLLNSLQRKLNEMASKRDVKIN